MPSQRRAESQTATLPGPGQSVVRVLFLGACLVVAYATLLPFRFTFDRVLATPHGLPRIVLQTHSPTPLSDLVGNVALFLPLGALAWLGLRRGHGRLGGLLRATLAGVSLSFVIEVVQCFTPTRTPAVSDVLANGAGSFFGALATMLAWPRLSRSAPVASLGEASRREPLSMALAGLVILVCMQAFFPFDYSLHPDVLRRALRMAQVDPHLDPGPMIDTSRVLLFALLGGVAFHATRHLTLRSLWGRLALCLGSITGLALVLEGMQILFKPQVMATKDVLGAMGGSTFGIAVAVLMARTRMGRYSWSLVTVAYGLCLLLPSTDRFAASGIVVMLERLQALVPLYAAHFRATLADVSEFTEVFILLVPMGFLSARECARLGLPWRWNTLCVSVFCVAWASLRPHLGLGSSLQPTMAAWIAAAALGGAVGSSSWLWFEASHSQREAAEQAESAVALGRTIA